MGAIGIGSEEALPDADLNVPAIGDLSVGRILSSEQEAAARTPFNQTRKSGGNLMLKRTYLLSSIALFALPMTAHAQEAPQPDDAAAANDEIVVTGTAGGGINRQDAAFAITSINSDAIERAAPNSTADLFKVIPGVSAESSGGQNGANIFVRGYPSGGDAEFVTLTVQGVPFFSPPTLSFLKNTQLIRIDETIERVEAVRGGTGALRSEEHTSELKSLMRISYAVFC